jgi:hypothetical protein
MVEGESQRHKIQLKIEVFKNESRVVFKNSYTFQKPLQKSITIRQLKQISLPSDGS